MTTNKLIARISAHLFLTLIPIPDGADSRKRASGRSHWLKRLAMMCCIVNSVSADTFGLFTYTEYTDRITITGYPTTAVGSVVIPTSINGKPVTSIGGGAFWECSKISSVSIPTAVTSIGNTAFYGCESMVTINIPAGVTTISFQAFFECRSLTSITIPSAVISIQDYAFYGCSGLTKIVIPPSVRGIYDYAFYGCWRLSSVEIPSTVVILETFVFAECWNLINVILHPGITSIPTSFFYGCWRLKTVTIPSSVTTIGNSAFADCVGLTAITIPSAVKSIWSRAFSSCANLKNAIFLGDAPAFGAYVFADVSPDFAILYLSGKQGFSSPSWNGYPAVDMGGSPDIPIWLISNGIPYDADLQSDANNDGVNLLMAYALGLNPLENLSAKIPVPVFSANQMRYTYYSGRTGITYRVESSIDLISWSTNGVQVSPPNANKFKTATIDMMGNRRFMRLVVE